MTSVFDNLWLSDLAPEIKRPKKKVATEKAEIPRLAYPKPWCDEAEFLRTIGDHKMAVLFDNGLMRHLRFSNGSFNRWFEIITWAGKLAISGDMGTFVFSRVEDMFTFFRGEREGSLKINPGYWAEKCIAQDRHGLKTFDSDYFMESRPLRRDSFLSFQGVTRFRYARQPLFGAISGLLTKNYEKQI